MEHLFEKPIEARITFTPSIDIPLKEISSSLNLLQGKRLLVMGSGNGSNFEVIVNALRPLGVEISGLFCDQPGAKIIERAHRLHIPSIVDFTHKIKSKRFLNNSVLEFLTNHNFDLLVLAGYMRVLPPRVVQPHKNKIINIHPSLLPSFPGLNAIQQAYEAKVSETGVTVHFVDEGVDTGPILSQGKLQIYSGESISSLEKRIHQLEHYLYPLTLLKLLISNQRLLNAT